MGLWQRLTGRSSVETRSIEDPQYNLSENPEALMAMLGVLDSKGALPPVSIDAALGVPAVLCAVGFLSRALASLPVHTYRAGEAGEKVDGNLAMMLNEAPNEETSSFEWRRHMWQQVFTGGRGMSWIERAGTRPVAMFDYPLLSQAVKPEARGRREASCYWCYYKG